MFVVKVEILNDRKQGGWIEILYFSQHLEQLVVVVDAARVTDIYGIVFVHLAVQQWFEQLHVFLFVCEEVVDSVEEFRFALARFEQESD